MLTTEEAVRQLRNDPQYAALIRDAYLGVDTVESGDRFLASGEFAEVLRLLDGRVQGAVALDLGAGTGIGSYALAKSGAKRVYALEPDPSNEIGQGAIRRLSAGLPVELVDAFGEEIPLPEGEVDIIYTRQVLHHASDLPRLVGECARVLKKGGVLIACREHVVDDQRQLELFLESHPVHRLAGGENAFSLDAYMGAIRSSGLTIERILGPWDSVINAFPSVRTREELQYFPRKLLKGRLGLLGVFAGLLPGVEFLIRRRLNRPSPGRMYSFVALKR